LAASLGAGAVLCVIVSVHLATVRLTLSADGVGVGAGIRGHTRWISAAEIRAAEATELSWPAVFGAGLPWSWRSTRLTVRAGRTLALWLASGERVWISTTDPATAAAVLARTPSTGMR
jgi:hypothetical protein